MNEITTPYASELIRTQRAIDTVRTANKILADSKIEAEILKSFCRVIVNSGGYYFSWISFAKSNVNKTVKTVAHAGFEHGYLEKIQVS